MGDLIRQEVSDTLSWRHQMPATQLCSHPACHTHTHTRRPGWCLQMDTHILHAFSVDHTHTARLLCRSHKYCTPSLSITDTLHAFSVDHNKRHNQPSIKLSMMLELSKDGLNINVSSVLQRSSAYVNKCLCGTPITPLNSTPLHFTPLRSKQLNNLLAGRQPM